MYTDITSNYTLRNHLHLLLDFQYFVKPDPLHSVRIPPHNTGPAQPGPLRDSQKPVSLLRGTLEGDATGLLHRAFLKFESFAWLQD